VAPRQVQRQAAQAERDRGETEQHDAYGLADHEAEQDAEAVGG
jgi:hypothetical protein